MSRELNKLMRQYSKLKLENEHLKASIRFLTGKLDNVEASIYRWRGRDWKERLERNHSHAPVTDTAVRGWMEGCAR